MKQFLETCNTIVALDSNHKASTITAAGVLILGPNSTTPIRILSAGSLIALKMKQPAIASVMCVTASAMEHSHYGKKHGAIKAITRSFKLSLALMPVMYMVKQAVGS